MILISHRGNISGSIPEAENKPDYIDSAILLGYDVEIDIWLVDGLLFLGHDEPQYKIDQKWIQDRKDKLWIHCKNIEAMVYFNSTLVNRYNYFWHQEDTVTLTSKNHIWAYPGNQPIQSSIAVMPEIHDEAVSDCIGVCSDNIKRYEDINRV
jgi:hypothetical protein